LHISLRSLADKINGHRWTWEIAPFVVAALTLGMLCSPAGSQTNEWTWMGGSNSAFAPGVYGTKGVPDPKNVPGGRDAAVTWTDSQGNFWLFGGRWTDGFLTYSQLNDLWQFNAVNKEWTWVSGSNATDAAGVYGTLGKAAAANVPGARQNA